jgi:hypothetical protein
MKDDDIPDPENWDNNMVKYIDWLALIGHVPGNS